MSNKTWCKEFYQVTAGKISKSNDDKEIIKHAVRKWTGLLPENLEKHEIEFIDRDLLDEEDVFLYIDGSSCGLCIKYHSGISGCPDCPLNKSLDGACDEEPNDIYFDALDNPQIMIDELNKLLE